MLTFNTSKQYSLIKIKQIFVSLVPLFNNCLSRFSMHLREGTPKIDRRERQINSYETIESFVF